MLHIIKRIQNRIFYVLVLYVFFSCGKETALNKVVVYYENHKNDEFYGTFLTTKYGGLNYYIVDKNERDKFFDIKNIDSIVIYIDKKKYIAEPLLKQKFSREIGKSDFNFFTYNNRVVIDTISKMNTLLIFSAKTDIEKLKENNVIKFEMR